MWERGLKYYNISLGLCHDLSLPLWERGLKYRYPVLRVLWRNVAPLVGAWIEIFHGPGGDLALCVAPLVGAWIEMVIDQNKDEYPESLPLWERGLKSERAV